jgi:hypothetical protein
MLVPSLLLAFTAFAACGDDGDPPDDAPAAARLIDAAITSRAETSVPVLADVEALIPLLANPGAPGSEGFSLVPTGAANTYAFSAPLDRDGDGTPEATISGTATLTGDPASGTDDLGGTITFSAVSAAGGGTLEGSFTFSDSPSSRQVHGTATLTGTVSGYSATLTIPSTAPVTIRPATGAGSAQPNVCGYSVNGDANVVAGGDVGTLSFTWRFSNGSRTIDVVNRSFTSSDAETTELDAKTLLLPCGEGASIDDWEDVWLQQWVCLPPEFGTEKLTITVRNATTVDVLDEDPPGSGQFNTFEASALPGNPHVLRGFFIAGPPGSTYREDFTWTMSSDGTRFSKSSRYVFQEGPNTGSGGSCGGRAEPE